MGVVKKTTAAVILGSFRLCAGLDCGGSDLARHMLLNGPCSQRSSATNTEELKHDPTSRHPPHHRTG